MFNLNAIFSELGTYIKRWIQDTIIVECSPHPPCNKESHLDTVSFSLRISLRGEGRLPTESRSFHRSLHYYSSQAAFSDQILYAKCDRKHFSTDNKYGEARERR
jgi:hypothetical protein